MSATEWLWRLKLNSYEIRRRLLCPPVLNSKFSPEALLPEPLPLNPKASKGDPPVAVTSSVAIDALLRMISLRKVLLLFVIETSSLRYGFQVVPIIP